MKQFCVRVNEELYEKVRQRAETSGIKLSDFLRDAIIKACEESDADAMQSHNVIPVLENQLAAKDEQIAHLHQLLAMGGKERERLAEQLQRTNLQLEDLRKPQTAWQRIKAVFAAESG